MIMDVYCFHCKDVMPFVKRTTREYINAKSSTVIVVYGVCEGCGKKNTYSEVV